MFIVTKSYSTQNMIRHRKFFFLDVPITEIDFHFVDNLVGTKMVYQI